MDMLWGMFPEELKALMLTWGEPGFRGKQLFRDLQKGLDFDGMTVLSKPLRERLKAEMPVPPVTVLEEHASREDGTVKLLYGLSDRNCVEGVLMRYHYGVTLCVSTQVGCAMGCLFCASTLDGCVRNLTAAEMVGQVLCANSLLKDTGERVSRLVLMGSGEPMNNYAEVLRFIRVVTHPEGMNLSSRRISLSTCGLPDGIRRLAGEGLELTLSLSLHAPDDETRRRIMPVARRYTIAETLDACRVYYEATGRRFILEYALIDGINASPEDAQKLSRLLKGYNCHVNLIALNTVKERNLYGASERQIARFIDILAANGISATRRRTMGDDIEGACGQLRKKRLEENGQ